MKHLAIALIAVAVIAADFLAGLYHLPHSTQHSWGATDTAVLAAVGVWFMIHSGRES